MSVKSPVFPGFLLRWSAGLCCERAWKVIVPNTRFHHDVLKKKIREPLRASNLNMFCSHLQQKSIPLFALEVQMEACLVP